MACTARANAPIIPMALGASVMGRRVTPGPWPASVKIGQRGSVSSPVHVQLDVSLARMLAERPLDLADLESVRLVMRGNSVIDWNRVHFKSRAEVDQFLSLQLIDPE